MPIEIDGKKVKVSCMGDIAVQPFFPEQCDGVAWLALSEGPPGEPGRNINGEVDEGPRLLGEMEGVLIGATDHRSLSVLINALTALRDRLRDGPPVVMGAEMEADIARGIAEQTAKDVDRQILNDMEKAVERERKDVNCGDGSTEDDDR